MIRILGSYHYHKVTDLAGMFGAVPGGVDFFADSGAFSASTVGARISLGEYAEWLLHHRRVINMAATLDVVGDWEATRRNHYRLLERVGDAVPIVPVYHVRSPWSELRRYCSESPIVALGGLVRLSGAGYRDAMLGWCAQCHKIAREYDVRLHGFGLTREPYPAALPWYSVDSAYWTSAARTGSLTLWNDRARRWDAFRVGTENARRHARLIGAYGGDARHVCAYGYGIISRVGDRGREDYRWLHQASLTAWLRYERHLRQIKPEVAPPRGGRITGVGPKIYLAAGTADDIRSIVSAATAEAAAHAAQPAGRS